MTGDAILVLGKPDAKHFGLLAQLPPDVTVRFAPDEAAARECAAEAEVVLCDLGRELASVFAQMRRLRWVHSLSAGVEHLLFPALVASDVTVTNGRGAFKAALAEFAMAAALHFAKDVPRLQRNQRQERWEAYDMAALHGATMGVVGYGEIGRATAALAKAFGMRVLALRRRPERIGDDPLVDEVVPRERLTELLARSDYVVVSAALTPETRGMIDAAALAVMKPTAVLINVGRGPIVVESALVDALRAKRLRGAALDVFDVEPLPAGHPFYRLTKVLLSPHTADHVTGWLERAVEVFLEDFARYRRGARLLNVVDKRAGY